MDVLACWIVWARWLVVLGWGIALAASVVGLPDLSSAKGGQFGGLVSASNPAIRTEIRAAHEFGFPVAAESVLVQRNAAGLSTLAQARR